MVQHKSLYHKDHSRHEVFPVLRAGFYGLKKCLSEINDFATTVSAAGWPLLQTPRIVTGAGCFEHPGSTGVGTISDKRQKSQRNLRGFVSWPGVFGALLEKLVTLSLQPAFSS
ncbi:MAG: hypothetical protein ONB48_06530 [candidate division KSB1 bacterium]|nr:hypothetical protein [candidate division KSB1 bacterium]MDZ7273197.1 hypothetical protein [candidate division KSB1 bacterium]MDZ7285299.1 hypothetical protein [candidate division KSB1 bacterium]MDZ7298331.1 hypothetical protein [candidate division KSB1 bacterium]MDZ7349036.1 hypothetical protein [candidate division KSB1 bacterium]